MEQKDLRVTPEDMGTLEPDQIFVFGSNEAGFHGAGAALYANKRFGAEMYFGFGPTGQTFAIPTKDWMVMQLPLEVVKHYVERFIAFTQMKSAKKTKFMVTRIGCGLAGFTVEQIAPLFKDCREQKNIWLPQDFHDFLDGTYVAPSVTTRTTSWLRDTKISL